MTAIDRLRVFVSVPEQDSRAAQTGATATFISDGISGADLHRNRLRAIPIRSTRRRARCWWRWMWIIRPANCCRARM